MGKTSCSSTKRWDEEFEEAADDDLADLADELDAPEGVTVGEAVTQAEDPPVSVDDIVQGLAEVNELAGVEETVEVVDAVGDLDETVQIEDAVTSEWDDGTIINEGTVNASGLEGGSIVISGLAVGNAGELHADGGEGSGGSITILATDVIGLADDSEITANAGIDGDGGEIIVYSERHLHFAGGAKVEAKGGANSGDGGFVELSGVQTIVLDGDVDTTAAHGKVGELFIDPVTLTVIDGAGPGDYDGSLPSILAGDPNVGANTISEQALEALAANSSVTLEASGTITFNDLVDDLLGLALDSSGSFTVRSTSGNVLFNDINDTIRTEGGSLTFEAGGDVVLGNLDTTGAAGTTSGAIVIDVADSATISGDLIGGLIAVTAAVNQVTIGSGVNLDSTSGAGGTFSIGPNVDFDGGNTVQLGGDISLEGGGLDLILNGAADSLNFGTTPFTLTASRDVRVEGGATVSSDPGADITIIADSDGAFNAPAFGGVLIDNSSAVFSGGRLSISGRQLSGGVAGGEAINLEGGVTANDGVSITAAGSAFSDVNVNGSVANANGDIDIMATDNITVIGVINSIGGSDVTLAADTDNSGSGKVTVSGPVATGDGIFTATGFEFENVVAGTVNAGAGAIVIDVEDNAMIGGDLTGGSIAVTAAVNQVTIADGVNLDSSMGGTAGTFTISEGVTFEGMNVVQLGGDVRFNGGGLDLLIANNMNFGSTPFTLTALRDVRVINDAIVSSDSGGDITVIADSDGASNPGEDAFGGVLISAGAEAINSGGDLTIIGTQLAVSTATNAAILLREDVSANGDISITGTNATTSVVIAGATSTNGTIGITSTTDLTVSGAVAAVAGNIVIAATNNAEFLGNLTGQTIDVTAGNGIGISNVVFDTTSGPAGELILSAGVTFADMANTFQLGGDISLKGGGLDFIIDGETINFGSTPFTLTALRDVHVINGATVSSGSGGRRYDPCGFGWR